MKSTQYLATVSCFEDWLSRVDVLMSDPVVCREAAVALVDEGFNTLPSLRGVRPGDAEFISDSTAAKALLRKAFSEWRRKKQKSWRPTFFFSQGTPPEETPRKC